MFSSKAMVTGICRKLRLNSQASATNRSFPPTRTLPPMASRLPPMWTVGSSPIPDSARASMPEVVVFPWVPAMQICS